MSNQEIIDRATKFVEDTEKKLKEQKEIVDRIGYMPMDAYELFHQSYIETLGIIKELIKYL